MEELSQEQIAELEAELLELQQQLRRQLESTSESSRPVDLDQPIGRLSRMDAMQQQKMAQASRRSARRRFDQVGAALSRIANDEYGVCLTCDEEIGYRRLKVRPESTMCLACQSAREQS